jgi:hypothetical protein
LLLSALLLSHVDARPSLVAHLVGYGSVEALDHAFRHAGLPAPGTMRDALRAVA